MEASTEQSSTATSTPADDEKISLARAKPADAASSKHANEDEFAVEGIIASVDCNPESVGRLVLTVNNVGMRFTYPSLKALRLVDSVKDITENGPVCSSWKGKHVRLYFYKAKNKPYAGELEAIQFF